MRKLVKVFVSVGAIALFSVNAQAAIYKCVNTKSKVYYIDKPCPKKDKETQFKAVKDPKNGYKPPAFVEDKVEKAKEGIVVGRDSSNNPAAQEHSTSASVNQKKGGGGSGSSGSMGASSGIENKISKSSSSNLSGGSKGQESPNSPSNNMILDGREPTNVEELIPPSEEAAMKGIH